MVARSPVLFALVLWLAALAMAGCFGTDDVAPSDQVDGDEVDPVGPQNVTAVYSPYFDVVAADWTHPQTGDAVNDTTYVLPLIELGIWDRTDVRVAIVGPDGRAVSDSAGPMVASAAVDVVAASVAEHGSERLRESLTFDVVWVPSVAAAAAAESDIFFVAAQPAGGFAAQNAGFIEALPGKCTISTPMWVDATTGEDRAGALVTAVHELLHCLGQDHPVDHCPHQDVMGYDWQCPAQPAQHADRALEAPYLGRCLSTMNLLALDAAFGPAFGEEAPETVEVDAVDYWIHDCTDAWPDSF